MPKGGSRKVPTNEMCERFFSALKLQNKGGDYQVNGLRWYSLFKTLQLCGLRSVEAVNLKPDDVDLEGMILHVCISKGPDSGHNVPIPEELLPWLESWASVRDRGSEWFWHTSTGAQVETSNLRTVAATTSEKAGIPQGYCTPHGFRHNFAGNVLAEGGNAFQLQRLLGHQSVTSTQVYTHVGVEDLRDVVNGGGRAAACLDDLRQHLGSKYVWLGREALRVLLRAVDRAQSIAEDTGYCDENGKELPAGRLFS